MTTRDRWWLPRFRLKWLMVVIAIISLGLAIYVSRPAPRAVALLHVDTTTLGIPGTPEYHRDEFDRFMATQRKLIKSDVVLDRVSGDPRVASLGL